MFLCINRGDSSEVIRKYWDKKGLSMRAVRQEGTTAGQTFGVLGYPTTYVIGPDGAIQYRSSGGGIGELRAVLLK